MELFVFPSSVCSVVFQLFKLYVFNVAMGKSILIKTTRGVCGSL